MPSLVVVVAVVALLAPAPACSAEEGTARNLIDDILDTFRNIFLNGLPEKGIPVMDPLTVDEWEFVVIEEPLLAAMGSVSQVKIKGLAAFVVEKQKIIPFSVIPPRVIKAVNMRVPNLTATGNFKLVGAAQTPVLADEVIKADGDFTMVVKDISCNVRVEISLNSKVGNFDVTLGIGDVFIDVPGHGKAGNLISDEAAFRIHSWFTENRSEMERQMADKTKKSMQNYLDQAAQAKRSSGGFAPTSRYEL